MLDGEKEIARVIGEVWGWEPSRDQIARWRRGAGGTTHDPLPGKHHLGRVRAESESVRAWAARWDRSTVAPI